MTKNELAKFFDSTILKQNATQNEIVKLCEDALKYGFASVCVNPYYVKLASQLLQGADTAICTVIGFPLGANLVSTKVSEADDALCDGASELDMVVNLSAYFSGDLQTVYKEIEILAEMAHLNSAILKVIIETALLNHNQKKELSKIASDYGADFVKTSTGFSTSGAKIEDIISMKSSISKKCLVKASGGIKTLEFVEQLIDAGANRIGTSSAASIIEEFNGKSAGW